MTSAQLAAELIKTPTDVVVLKIGNDWVEVLGVQATGEHRAAITFRTVEDFGRIPGVIVFNEFNDEKV